MINTKVDPNSPYFSHLRMELLKLCRSKPTRVLEVGCGTGQTLLYFKSLGAEFLAGIELVPEVADMARKQKGIDEVVTGNIEQVTLPYSAGSFDLIIVSHVLEHVTNPWHVTASLVQLLKPGGQLIGSLPNVRCLSVTGPLVMKGRWDYTQEGILDWTHFRFFTRHSIGKLLTESGLEVREIEGEVFPRGKLALINKLSLGVLRDFCAFTFNFSAIRLS